MTFNDIILIVGFSLLFISAISVFALLLTALKRPDQSSDEINIGTLWALFLFGLFMGMFLLFLAIK